MLDRHGDWLTTKLDLRRKLLTEFGKKYTDKIYWNYVRFILFWAKKL